MNTAKELFAQRTPEQVTELIAELTELLQQAESDRSVDAIIKVCCDVVNSQLFIRERDQIHVTHAMVHTKSRYREILTVKQIATVLIKSIHYWSYGKIAKRLGGLNHATCINSVRRFNELYNYDRLYRLMADNASERLKMSDDELRILGMYTK